MYNMLNILPTKVSSPKRNVFFPSYMINTLHNIFVSHAESEHILACHRRLVSIFGGVKPLKDMRKLH